MEGIEPDRKVRDGGKSTHIMIYYVSKDSGHREDFGLLNRKVSFVSRDDRSFTYRINGGTDSAICYHTGETNCIGLERLPSLNSSTHGVETAKTLPQALSAEVKPLEVSTYEYHCGDHNPGCSSWHSN